MQEIKNPEPCPFNGAVVCLEQLSCNKCGWNPKVAKERLCQIEEKKRRK